MVAERLPRPTNNPKGRPSNVELAARVVRLRAVVDIHRTESHALRGELVVLADEIAALGRRVELAILADRPDVAIHVAGRLSSLADSCRRRGAA